MKKTSGRQQGVSLSGLLIWIVIIILVGVGAMKLIPSYIQNAEIKDIFSTIVHDPEMQNAPIKSIRESYSKRANMNNISIIDANDVEISKDASGLALSASYQVKIPLIGNATLILDFNPSSE